MQSSSSAVDVGAGKSNEGNICTSSASFSTAEGIQDIPAAVIDVTSSSNTKTPFAGSRTMQSSI
jgi:hypothetical protein